MTGGVAAAGRGAGEFITFEDIFVLALASAKGDRFRADSADWHRVLYEVCQKFRDKIPELRVVFFEERPPLPPQTDQFYQLISTLSMADLVSLPNPNFAYIVMDEERKRQAKALEGGRLDQYLEYIEEIAGLLDSNLAVEH